MAGSRSYYTLVASLPHMRPPFFHDQTPLSRIRLERRLRLLEPEDGEVLVRAERMVSWSRVPFGVDDVTLLAATLDELPRVPQGPIRTLVEDRLALRTITAALRRRRRGDGPPAPGEAWGYPPYARGIRERWAHPTFGLGARFGWIADVDASMRARDPLAAERRILMAVWEDLDRVGAGHLFDFVAVVVYVMRWQLVARWVEYDGPRALARFDHLTEQGMGSFARMFP